MAGAHHICEIEDRNGGVVGADYGVPISVLVVSGLAVPSFRLVFVRINQDPCD